MSNTCLAATYRRYDKADDLKRHKGKDQLNHEQSSRLGSYTNQFAFDNAGNPTTWKGATQTFNTANQNNAFTYDGDGNPKTWQSNNLTFDAGNHLTAIGTTLTAGYNAEGLRAWKQSASGTTYFLYDGLTPIVELDGNANVKAVNTWGANGLLSRRTVSTNSSVFYTFDEQGSTAQRLDSGGNILGSYGFDAFGTRASTDNSSDPYSGFGAQWGYYRDSETGLSLCGHRYYDPGQGRWLNRDPIGYAGGLNFYAYADSNPLAGADPLGLAKVEVRYKFLGGIFGYNWYHAYIVVTDPNGSVQFIRGGPSGGGGPNVGSSCGSSSQGSGSSPRGPSPSANGSSNSSNSSSPGTSRGGTGKNNGPFGPIVLTAGPYVPDSIDYETGNPPSSVIVNDNRPASYYMTKFRGTGQQITNANVSYNPFTTNSNAFVTDVLKASGLKVPQPPVNVPGWGTNLPYK